MPGSPAHKPPSGLGEAGREAWREAWATGWVTDADRAGLAHLARLEHEAERLTERIECEGVTSRKPIITPKGESVGDEWVAHPLVAQLRRLDPQLQTLRTSLGLTPASRARYALERIERHPDALDELVERRRKRLASQRRAVP